MRKTEAFFTFILLQMKMSLIILYFFSLTEFFSFFLSCLRRSTNEKDVRHVTWIKNDWNEYLGRLSRTLFLPAYKISFYCACHGAHEVPKHKRTTIWLCSVNKKIASWIAGLWLQEFKENEKKKPEKSFIVSLERASLMVIEWPSKTSQIFNIDYSLWQELFVLRRILIHNWIKTNCFKKVLRNLRRK